MGADSLVPYVLTVTVCTLWLSELATLLAPGSLTHVQRWYNNFLVTVIALLVKNIFSTDGISSDMLEDSMF